MNLEIHGLTENLFVDIIFLWCFVSIIILSALMLYAILFINSGLLTINDDNIIKKIIKLKNGDRYLYKFAKKLSKDNYEFLHKYKRSKFERVVILNNLTQKLERFLSNDYERRLYKKIEGIIYYYDLINMK